MIEGFGLGRLRIVDRGDMQIPLPPYAIAVDNVIHSK
jgi:hypothetical protein